MANLTYNGINNPPSNILTFTDVPNILKVEETVTGVKAQFNFTFTGDLRATVTADSQYFVTFLGETVSNVIEPSAATNKRFYCCGDPVGTAVSFARALRNCSGIAADFNVIHNGSVVTLAAKTIGEKWSSTPYFFQTNIPNTGSATLTTEGNDGNSFSVFFNSKIDVDVYSDYVDADKYVTTLEKNFYGDECAFDVSPVLSTISEYGTTKPYIFVTSMVRDDGEWASIGQVSGYTTIGYTANQSEKFKYLDSPVMLLNKNKGSEGNMILYTYSNVIDFSILFGSNTGALTIGVSCKGSANNEIYTTSSTVRRPNSGYIKDYALTIPSSVFILAYYVDITIGNDVTRFNVIKPLKATEYYQRIQWRNEYGGISFFDFTGSRSESDNVSIETYEKNIFDYYTNDAYEKKKIYKNEYDKTVTLTSHLLEKDGKWIFNSLMRSKKVWTTINDVVYYIIPKTIEVVEDQNYNDIYTAKLSYEYSDI